MSQRLKINDYNVLNLEEITCYQTLDANTIVFYLITSVFNDDEDPLLAFTMAAGTGKADNLKKAIDKAITASPSGRVVEVPAGDYTPGNLTFTGV